MKYFDFPYSREQVCASAAGIAKNLQLFLVSTSEWNPFHTPLEMLLHRRT